MDRLRFLNDVLTRPVQNETGPTPELVCLHGAVSVSDEQMISYFEPSCILFLGSTDEAVSRHIHLRMEHSQNCVAGPKTKV